MGVLLPHSVTLVSNNNSYNMEWVNIESLTLDGSIKRNLNQILEKEKELDPNNIPPIKIDYNGKIIDGVKRYLVLMKWEYDKVPVVKENKSRKVQISYSAKPKESVMLAA
jgi:hypothetical protein